MGQKADLVLYNADVLTLDPRRPRAGLVVVKDGRIVHIGSSDERRDFEGRAIDCEGKTLIPGIIDAHCHILALASTLLSVDCSPSSVSSIEDIKAEIQSRARRAAKGTWIRAAGYNDFYLNEGRHPTRRDLDQAAPHHPVRLVHRSRHACVLNSMALSLLGIYSETAEPEGGMIERELDSGEPSGLLFDMNAYVDERIPPLTSDDLEEGVRLANEDFLSRGVTSLQDATSHNGLDEWQRLCGLRERGLLVPRLTAMMGIDALDILEANGLAPRHGSDDARMGALKVMLTETRGYLYPSQDELNQAALGAHLAGYQLAFHAVERATVAAAATALEHALAQSPRDDHRHRIEHCSECPPPLMERLRRLGAIVVTNPSFIYYSGDRYLEMVPPDQRQWLYRIGSFLKEGMMPAAGSDSPVAPLDPMAGVYAAVTRGTEGGGTLLAEEGVSVEDALAMWTRAAAYSSFDEGVKGSIAVGMLADLALLSADPTEIKAEDIRDIAVEMTIIGGNVVWQS